MSELATVDDAFAQALTESEENPISDAPETLAEEAFDFDAPEQTTAESVSLAEGDVGDELFDDIEIDGVEPDVEPSQTVSLDNYRFEVPGQEEPVSFQELKDGFLRHKDYTQKTQALADQRKTNEKAIKLYEAIQADPMAVARQIAEEVGLIKADAQPTKAVEFSVFQTAEAVEAEIQRRVQEAVTLHPAVVEANEARARDWVAGEFARIEESHGVKLGPKSRQMILQFAGDRQVADLELVFNHFMAQKQTRSDNARRVAAAAPGRPTGRAMDREVVEEADTIEAAFAMAEAEVGR